MNLKQKQTKNALFWCFKKQDRKQDKNGLLEKNKTRQPKMKQEQDSLKFALYAITGQNVCAFSSVCVPFR